MKLICWNQSCKRFKKAEFSVDWTIVHYCIHINIYLEIINNFFDNNTGEKINAIRYPFKAFFRVLSFQTLIKNEFYFRSHS